LLGFDPKEKIDEDFQVLKGLIESKYPASQELKNFHKA
jgi:hypothetical protein